MEVVGERAAVLPVAQGGAADIDWFNDKPVNIAGDAPSFFAGDERGVVQRP